MLSLLALACFSPPAPQTVELSGAFALPLVGRIEALHLDAHGGVVYQTDSGAFFAARLDASRPSVPLGASTRDRITLSADGSRVGYWVGSVGGNSGTVWSARTDGGAPPIAIDSYAVAHPQDYAPALSQDGEWVAYAQTLAPLDLVGARADGSTAPVVLFGAPGDSHVFGPDGRTVFFLSHELYAVPVDGSAPARRLSAPGEVSTFQFTADGTRVLYSEAPSGATREQLFIVPIDGSAGPLQLSEPHAPGCGLGPFFPRVIDVTADGRRVVYAGDLDVSERMELYCSPLDGSTPPQKLSGLLGPDRDVRAALALEDSRHV